MKYLIASIALALGAFPSDLSAQIAHDLTIFSEDGHAFTLLLNGQQVNAGPAASVTAPNINFDYAKVEVRFVDEAKTPIVRKNLQIAMPGTGPKGPVATVYAIKEKKGEQVLRFVSRSEKKIQDAPVIIINN
jgi:hypothetical protein